METTGEEKLSQKVAEHILQRLSEGGQPPEIGVGHINVGTDNYLQVLESEYFQGILKGGSSFKLVEGYFGGGKTHFLFCVRELAWKHEFVASFVELSPAECPYDDPLKVYKAVAKNLCPPPGAGEFPSPGGLTDLLDDFLEDIVQIQGRKAAELFVRKTAKRVPCESHSFRQAIYSYMKAELAGDEEIAARIGAWLQGEPVSAAMVKDLGVFETMSKANAFAMLRSLSQVLAGLGIPGLVLLFDEVDRNMSVGMRRTRAIGDNLRQVIDLCGRAHLPNTLFLYAVPPEFMRNVVPEYPALYQRLKSPLPFSKRSPQAPIIDLQSLDMAPVDLLNILGRKILYVFEKARGVEFDQELQNRNIASLARECVDREFELNHRRLFVKVWTDALFRQIEDGQEDISKLSHEDEIVGAMEELVSKGEVWEDMDDEDELEGDELEKMDENSGRASRKGGPRSIH
ncbi:MAG: hypothetical protein GXP49_10410 [Deltaproteobacteria bacterium]|nr:hypothetical protein [Deltaproteobacteria bacterium]